VPRRLAEEAGLTQSGVPAKTAGRSIKRMVPFDVAQGGEHVEPQLRKRRLDGDSWESPVEGQTSLSEDTRRSSIYWEKASAIREAKGTGT
jgi:hypothetical protein